MSSDETPVADGLDVGEPPTPSVTGTDVPSRPRKALGYSVRHGLVVFVVLVVLLAVYLFGGTALTHNRAQHDLAKTFRERAAVVQLPPTYEVDATTGLADLTRPKPIGTGDPVAWLKVSKIGFSEVAVEGSSASQTLRGPGHVRSTPLPGQFGNSVFICRRLTGGAPCADIKRLRVGDEIVATTQFGDVKYRVISAGAAPGNDAKIFGPLPVKNNPKAFRNTLTLATSDPAIIASRRYAVQAELVGDAKNYTPSRVQVQADQLGLAGERDAWFPLLLAMQLMLALSIGAVWLTQRWKLAAAWMVSAPLLVFAAWLVFEQFLRVLPGAL